MAMLKKHISFFNRQINQLREDGVRALYRKIRKLFRLFFMNIFAPLAVHSKINWAEAYDFLGKKSFKKLKELYTQTNPNESAIKKVVDQTIKYFKTIVDRGAVSVNKQVWIDASRALGALYFPGGKMTEMNDVFQKEAEIQRGTAQTHQFDDLGIEFLPRYLPVGSIGCYEHLEAYVKAGMLGLRPSKRLILLVDPKAPVNNPCYLDYWRRYITVISDPLLVEMLAPLEKRLTIPLNLYMFLRGKMCKSFLALGIVRERWLREKRPPLLTLLDKDYQRGWQHLKSFGMKPGDWFVCLHARERGWKDNNSSAEDFRNTDIDTYLPGIKAVVDAGGWVIRMGDPTMKPLPSMPRVIDYAHSGIKSDWMDVFLCAQCRFFVGTSSGLFIFATSFGTPVVATNFLPTCCAYYLTSKDLFIPRICKREGGPLSFAELFSPSVGTAAVKCIYDFKNIEVVENSAEEIRDLIEEALAKFDGRWQSGPEDEELQRQFQSLTADCGKRYGNENAVVNARIGQSFLRKYATLLPVAKAESVIGY